MAAALRLRNDFDAERLRSQAKGSKDGPKARRLLTLAAIYDGAARSEAAKIGGVTLPIVRDWVLRFNAHGPDGLLDRKAPGAASLMQNAAFFFGPTAMPGLPFSNSKTLRSVRTVSTRFSMKTVTPFPSRISLGRACVFGRGLRASR